MKRALLRFYCRLFGHRLSTRTINGCPAFSARIGACVRCHCRVACRATDFDRAIKQACDDGVLGPAECILAMGDFLHGRPVTSKLRPYLR